MLYNYTFPPVFPPLILFNSADLYDHSVFKRKLLEEIGKRGSEYHFLENSKQTKKISFQSLDTLSLFVRHSCYIYETEAISKDEETEIVKLGEKRGATLVVLVQNTISQQLRQHAEKKGIYIAIESVKPWEQEKYIVHWLQHEVKNYKREITTEAASLLFQMTTGNRFQIIQELEKIDAYLSPSEKIEKSAVLAVSTAVVESTIWQIEDAWFYQKHNDLIQVLSSMRRQDIHPLIIIRTLRNKIRVLLEILSLIREKNTHEISTRFSNLKGQILQKTIQTAETCGEIKLLSMLTALDDFEYSIKDSQNSDEMQALEEMLLSCHIGCS